MKLKCVDDHWAATNGFLGIGAKPETKIKGLTLGKVYEGLVVTSVTGDGNIGFGSINSSYDFLIFNDDGEWESYQLNLFEPT